MRPLLVWLTRRKCNNNISYFMTHLLGLSGLVTHFVSADVSEGYLYHSHCRSIVLHVGYCSATNHQTLHNSLTQMSLHIIVTIQKLDILEDFLITHIK